MVDQAASTGGGSLLAAGMRLGKYQLIRRLAVGGMAEIFLARSSGIEGFEKVVVLKRILPQHAANEDFVAMFLAEARLAASLHHPNIAQTYDIGSEGGQYFFTMEFVHGEDLREITRALGKAGRRLPLDCALAIVLGVASGLHHAHEKRGPDGAPLGLVHRDISPSNILVSHDGAVKIVDFGIAKATALRVDTRGGSLKGKVSYMSPEQCRGEPLDRRSDVYAIGILLWEITTGLRLYKGDNEFAIMSQVVDGAPTPPSVVVPGYPPALERIVLRALARSRDDRYATAAELQAALEELALAERLTPSGLALARLMEELFGKKEDPTPLVLAEGSGMREPPRRGSRWALWVGIGGAVAVAAAVAVAVAVPGSVPVPVPVPVSISVADSGSASVSASASASDAGSASIPDAPRPKPEPIPEPKLTPKPKPKLSPTPTPPPKPTPPPPPPPPAWDSDSALPPPSK